MDANCFIDNFTRFTQWSGVDANQIASSVEGATAVATAALIRALGLELASIEMLGVELTCALRGPSQTARSSVVGISDLENALEELRRDGTSLIDVKVKIVNQSGPVGMATLSFAVDGRP
jgi:hypothetical protein